jgi:predicted pyridoxine 5'-phosphate oxidase superfamily flavin-nucleotide-binding protein
LADYAKKSHYARNNVIRCRPWPRTLNATVIHSIQSKNGHKLLLAQPHSTRADIAKTRPRSLTVPGVCLLRVTPAWHRPVGYGICLRYNRVCLVESPHPKVMTHEPRLTLALRSLLNTQRVAALGTLDEAGQAFVSMVPFAIDSDTGALVIHVSGLAAHARNLERTPRVSLLVMQAEVASEPVHALPRVTLDAVATVLTVGSPAWVSARAAYLARFPDVEYMTQLGDFRFVALAVTGARQVAGFGAARSIDADELAQVLRHTS